MHVSDLKIYYLSFIVILQVHQNRNLNVIQYIINKFDHQYLLILVIIELHRLLLIFSVIIMNNWKIPRKVDTYIGLKRCKFVFYY
jgi:hypothetical protein